MISILAKYLPEHYRRYGVMFPLRVLSDEEVVSYRIAVDKLEIALSKNSRIVEVKQMHLHFRWAYDLTTHPRVLDAVEQVLGPDILVWSTELFTKSANDPNSEIAWHRDYPYIGLAPNLTVAVWIALSPSNLENGCLEVQLDPEHMKRDSHGTSQLSDVPTVPVILEPGEMSMHDININHRSGPNLSKEKRVGFVVRFVASQALSAAGRPKVVLAHGRDLYNNFEIVPAPSTVDMDTALTGMRESALRNLDEMLYEVTRSLSVVSEKTASPESLVSKEHNSKIFSIWKTIKVGKYLSVSDLIIALESRSYHIGRYARRMMESKGFAITLQSKEIDLVKCTIRDLGFKESPTLREIIKRGAELLMDPCALEDGPALREQYPDQPLGEVVWMIAKSLPTLDGLMIVFNAGVDGGGKWLYGLWYDLEFKWDLNADIVFRLHKQET